MRCLSLLAAAIAGGALGVAIVCALPAARARNFAAARPQALASQVASLAAQVNALNKKVDHLEARINQISPKRSFAFPYSRLPYQTPSVPPPYKLPSPGLPFKPSVPFKAVPDMPRGDPSHPSNIPPYSIVMLHR